MLYFIGLGLAVGVLGWGGAYAHTGTIGFMQMSSAKLSQFEKILNDGARSYPKFQIDENDRRVYNGEYGIQRNHTTAVAAPLPSVENPIYFEVDGGDWVNRHLIFQLGDCPDADPALIGSPGDKDTESNLEMGFICRGKVYKIKNVSSSFAHMQKLVANGTISYVEADERWTAKTSTFSEQPIGSLRRVTMYVKEWEALQARANRLAAGALDVSSRISNAAADAFYRAPVHAAGIAAGVTRRAGDSVIGDAPGIKTRFTFKADNSKCIPVGKSQMQCSYDLSAIYRKEMMGFGLPDSALNLGSRRDTFTVGGNVWQSATLNAKMTQVADTVSGGRPSASGDEAERKRLFDKCLEDRDRIVACVY